jgi:hypothetical protein
MRRTADIFRLPERKYAFRSIALVLIMRVAPPARTKQCLLP